MKKLLSVLLLFVSFGAFAQTYDTLPTGSKPYGNQLYLSPMGLIIGGTGSAKFRVIGTKKYVDSLLALKADMTALELYQTKANLSTDLAASATKYPNVNAVNTGLNTKANIADVILSQNGSGTNTTLTGATLAGTSKIATTPGDSYANFDFITRDKTTGEIKKIDQAVIPDLAPYQIKSEKGQANGYAGLDGAGKVPLTQINDALLGAVNYRGTYNAAANTPALPAVGSSNKGYYWIISTAGTQFGLDFRVGDWIISNGSSYGKVASSSDVESVAGKKGVVLLTKNDVQLGNVDNTSDALKPISNATNTALGLKADKSSLAAGQTIGASTTGTAAASLGLSSYNGANTLRWGWDGNFFTTKVDNSDFGNTIPLNITGNAATATNWGGLEADFSSYGTNLLAISGFDVPTNKNKLFQISTVKSALATSLKDVTDVNPFTTNISIRSLAAQGTGAADMYFQSSGNNTNSGYSEIQGSYSGINYANPIVLQRLGGNVGIGTTAPTAKLHVLGDVFSSGAGAGYTFSDRTVNSKLWQFYADGGRMGLYNTILNANALTVLDNGNVGIGKANPTDMLDVNGDISNYSRSIRISQEAGFTQIVAGVGKGHKFYTNDGQYIPLTLANGSRVGVNTTTPNEALEVNGLIRSTALAGAAGDRLASIGANGNLQNTGIAPGAIVFDYTNGQTISGSKIFSGYTQFTGATTALAIGFVDGNFRNQLSANTLTSNTSSFLPNANTQLTGYTTTAVPTTATSTGAAGEIRVGGGYMYLCTSPNVWVRSAIQTNW